MVSRKDQAVRLAIVSLAAIAGGACALELGGLREEPIAADGGVDSGAPFDGTTNPDRVIGQADADAGPDVVEAGFDFDACPISWGCRSNPGVLLCAPGEPCDVDGGNYCCGGSCFSGGICLGPANECDEAADCPSGLLCCGDSYRYPPRLACATECTTHNFQACKIGSSDCACGLYCVDSGRPVLACAQPTQCP